MPWLLPGKVNWQLKKMVLQQRIERGLTYYWLPATFRHIMATTIILDIGKQEEIGVEVFAQ